MQDIELLRMKTILKRLWLGDSEVQIFLLWLENGALTIAQLSQLSNIWRITVHEIVARLIKKWLYLETKSGRKRLVYPNQVDAIERLLDQKTLELQQLKKDAKNASSLLQAIQTQSENFPKTRFYKGQEWIQKMLSEIKKDAEDIAIMSDGQHFYELIDNDFLEKTLDLRNKKKLHVQLLFPTWFEYFSYTQGTYQQQLEIKSLPQQDILKGGMTIWWKKVALHCYEGKFITTTILENTQIRNILTYLYKMTRDQAKTY